MVFHDSITLGATSMNYKNELTHERLTTLLSYDKDAGCLHWKTHRAGQPKPGTVAGVVAPDGYRKIRVDGENYQAHRLIWLYMTGNWPTSEIDHINLDKSDNRWANLREASHKQNMRNVARRKRNKTGYKGVYNHQGTPWWRAQISIDGKAVYLGTFRDPKLAHQAYVRAATAASGQFSRAG